MDVHFQFVGLKKTCNLLKSNKEYNIKKFLSLQAISIIHNSRTSPSTPNQFKTIKNPRGFRIGKWHTLQINNRVRFKSVPQSESIKMISIGYNIISMDIYIDICGLLLSCA